MDTKSKSSGPGLLVWAVAFVAIGALAFLGWRSNQAKPTAAPVNAPAAAPAKAQPEAPPPMRNDTETNGALAG